MPKIRQSQATSAFLKRHFTILVHHHAILSTEIKQRCPTVAQTAELELKYGKLFKLQQGRASAGNATTLFIHCALFPVFSDEGLFCFRRNQTSETTQFPRTSQLKPPPTMKSTQTTQLTMETPATLRKALLSASSLHLQLAMSLKGLRCCGRWVF